MITTGQCSTCQNLFCETPKVRKTHPQLGCPQWTTEEAAKQVRDLKPMKIEESKWQ